MNASLPTAAILGFAALLGILRLLSWRAKAVPAAPRWRIAVLLFAQPLCALLLYFTLLPPRLANVQRGEMLAVLAADSTAAQLTQAQANGAVVVALPEAPEALQRQAERQPDLATALRRYPQAARLRVLGSGLEARDRDVAAAVPIEFTAPTPAHGFLHLQTSRQLAPGQSFEVAGQVPATKGDRIELLDPAGRRADIATPGIDGRFRVEGDVRSAGLARFELRLLGAGDRIVERASVPLWVVEPEPLRALLLAGAPSPELKYLRRWADDAGIELRTRIDLGGGIALGDAPALDSASLQKLDLLVLDSRALDNLDAGRRAALRQAIDRGLGVLVRIDGAISPGTRAQLRGWGFVVDGGGDVSTVKFSADASAGDAAPPSITTRRLRVTAADAIPLLRDAENRPLGYWRASGRGRVGLWPLVDTYAWVLHGDAGRHGKVWSQVFATLARPGAQRFADIGDARIGQRVSICPVGDSAEVLTPDTDATRLLPDPQAGMPACAGFWPRQAGWHWLREGERAQPFFVHAANDAPGLQRIARSDATRALTGGGRAIPDSNEPQAARHGPRGPSWPWFLAWLACAAALWWLERRRRVTAP